MGVVLKRRDNAPILKILYGGTIDRLMEEKNIHSALKYLEKGLMDLMNGKYPLETLVISKTLNGYYKNPKQIAHKVLADRIAARDPGNKP